MFVAQVVSHSMEPLAPDGAFCFFVAPVVGSRTGQILLVQHRDTADSETGGSFTVKQFDSSEVTGKDSTERTGNIYLRPINPAYEPIVLTGEEDICVIAELVEVLRPD